MALVLLLIIFWFSFANKKDSSKDQYLSQAQLNQILNRFDEYRKKDREYMQKSIDELKKDMHKSIDELKKDMHKSIDELTNKMQDTKSELSSQLNMSVDILSHNYAIEKLKKMLRSNRNLPRI